MIRAGDRVRFSLNTRTISFHRKLDTVTAGDYLYFSCGDDKRIYHGEPYEMVSLIAEVLALLFVKIDESDECITYEFYQSNGNRDHT